MWDVNIVRGDIAAALGVFARRNGCRAAEPAELTGFVAGADQ
jgi:hypothetical protein